MKVGNRPAFGSPLGSSVGSAMEGIDYGDNSPKLRDEWGVNPDSQDSEVALRINGAMTGFIQMKYFCFYMER